MQRGDLTLRMRAEAEPPGITSAKEDGGNTPIASGLEPGKDVAGIIGKGDKITGMSVLTDVNNIDNVTLQYLPAAFATVQAIEVRAPAGTTNTQKFNLASQILAGIAAGSQAVAQTPGVPVNVTAIAGLINLAVTIEHFFGGIFNHIPAPVASAPPVVAAAPPT